jgi:hypothetical protein
MQVEGQHGNVIVLTEGHRFRGGLLRTGLAAREDGEPVEPVKLTGSIARFQQAVGVESEMIAWLQLTREFLVNRAGKDTQGKCTR